MDYTVAFHARLLECSDVSNAEVLDHYVAGLKPMTRDWVLIHNPTSMHQAAKWAERYDNTSFSKHCTTATSSANPGGGNSCKVCGHLTCAGHWLHMLSFHLACAAQHSPTEHY